jgi:hypothetical protein
MEVGSMLDTRFLLGMLAGLLIAVGAAVAVWPGGGTAQPAVSSGTVAITPGPGGMWILRGDRVNVCTSGIASVGAAPPAPVCGASFTLR